jgi:8-oxo-dGTP pyrophosphatase MutT (NUDIX family)
MPDWLPPDEYVRQLPRCTVYACLNFVDAEGRMLGLRSTRSVEAWQWPGGNLDEGETPWDCALRECEEETGLRFTGPERLLGMHFIRPRELWKANHIGFIFDGGVLTADQLAGIRLSEEHSEWRVQTVTEWQQLMSPRNFARLPHIDQARRTRTAAYFVE